MTDQPHTLTTAARNALEALDICARAMHVRTWALVDDEERRAIEIARRELREEIQRTTELSH